ncbi:MAG: GspH/FimT family pseudopilin [Nitrosomonadales bacterium]
MGHTGRSGQRGVTLVELLIGLAILAVLLALAAPYAGQIISNAKIRTAAEAIESGLQLARSSAVNQNAQVQFALLTGTDSSWTVGCVTPVAGVQSCPAVIQSHTAAEGTSQAIVAADQTAVVFNGFGAANPAANICVGLTGVTTACAASTTERRLMVTVGTTGRIRLCDPALSQPDPQAC